MTVLGELKREMVQPAWLYEARGVVWRLVSTDSGLLIGEVRDLESKQASFFCLNRKSGDVLWDGVAFSERWWIGIEAVHRDRLFLHGFSTPDMPGHKGIIVVDVATGRIVWENTGLRFILCCEDSVFASGEAPEGLKIHELNCRTGETIKTWINHSESLEAAKARARMQESNERFPQPLEFCEAADVRVLNILRDHCSMEHIVGSIEVLVMNDLLFFSYHERENKGTDSGALLRNILKIANLADGKLEFTTNLNAGVSAAVPESFFVARDMLYYIKDRTSVAALHFNNLNG